VSRFETLAGDPASSVILHVPHASTYVPDDVRAGIVLDDGALAAELAAITDARTDVIAQRAAAATVIRPWLFVNRTSRLVVDPERFPDEREEMAAIGMGAVYERTTGLEVLRRPTAAERQALLDEYYTPYGESLARLVRDRLAAVGQVTIIDVHSYPREAPPHELHGDGPRPEICIGTDAFHTPASLGELAVDAMRAAAPTGDVGLDSPFSGCYVPLEQYETNDAVRAVMHEIRRDVVAGHLAALVAGTARLVDAIEA
jgi:N-formylglutamate deformylase